ALRHPLDLRHGAFRPGSAAPRTGGRSAGLAAEALYDELFGPAGALGGKRARRRPLTISRCDRQARYAVPAHSGILMFTSSVICFQAFICSASQAGASSGFCGITLKFCLPKAASSAGSFSALATAARNVAMTSFGVSAGANRACQASVPTPG